MIPTRWSSLHRADELDTLIQIVFDSKTLPTYLSLYVNYQYCEQSIFFNFCHLFILLANIAGFSYSLIFFHSISLTIETNEILHASKTPINSFDWVGFLANQLQYLTHEFPTAGYYDAKLIKFCQSCQPQKDMCLAGRSACVIHKIGQQAPFKDCAYHIS